jgi:hypothetical protein
VNWAPLAGAGGGLGTVRWMVAMANLGEGDLIGLTPITVRFSVRCPLPAMPRLATILRQLGVLTSLSAGEAKFAG